MANSSPERADTIAEPGVIPMGAALIELAQDLGRLNAACDLVARFERFSGAVGFTSTVCLLFPAGGELSLDDVMVNTRPKQWASEYLAAHYYRSDPVLAEAMSAEGSFTWSDITARGGLEPEAAMVMMHAAEHGMTDGFVVPIFDHFRNVGLVSLAGDGCDVSAASRAALSMAALTLHNRLAGLMSRHSSPQANLTAREIEIMRWIAVGKSDWDIGQILGLSGKTVNYHVERVKMKLGVGSRTQAVIRALGLEPPGPQG